MSCAVIASVVTACLGDVSEVEIVEGPRGNSILRRIDWSRTGVSFVTVKRSSVPMNSRG